MAELTQSTFRIDKDIKNKAAEVLAKQGLDISSVIKILLTKIANEERVPLELNDTPNTRDEIRRQIQLLAMSGEIRKIDLRKKDDFDDFYDEDHPEYR